MTSSRESKERTSGRGISVAMCTYNGARFLQEQLQSIAAQNRPPDELVVCDDGSRDESVRVVEAFRREARFAVRLEVNEQNLGVTKNFEKAIGLCTGEIIALSDQDDVWHPEKLSSIANALDADQRVGAVFSDAELIGEDGQSLGGTLWSTFRFTSREHRKFKDGKGLRVLLKHSTVTGATMAFRSTFRTLVLPIPPNHVQDHWIALLIASVSHLAPLEAPLVRYRRHGGQQIGPGNWDSLSRVIDVAKDAGRDHYFKEVRRFAQMCERLGERAAAFPPHADSVRLIRQKIEHRKARGNLSSSRVMRIPLLLREVATCRYWRYSNGFGSVAKDLMI